MLRQPYEDLSDKDLLALCIWREARGETLYGKRCVACVIVNRVKSPGWWGHDLKSVILKPWQFSSFNASDTNSDKWPDDDLQSWIDSLSAAEQVLSGEVSDLTYGAQYYYDTSIKWPKAWGNESEYTNTLNIGHLKFFRHNTPNNHDAVSDAVNG